jgi:hypothetical protein
MRFESGIDLRLYGSREEAVKYIPEARKILGDVWNRDLVIGELDQSWRRVQLSSTVWITVHATRFHAPIVTITALAEEPVVEQLGNYLLLAAWYPEGLTLTPRSATLPQGKGLPSRDPLTGDTLSSLTTSNPVFPQVLLNQYANNKYLDKQSFIEGTVGAKRGMTDAPPQLRSDASSEPADEITKFRYWYKLPNPLDYSDTPFEFLGLDYWTDPANQSPYPTVPGEYLVTEEIVQGIPVQRATLVTAQKDTITGQDTLFEPESDEWFSHRPEEILYPSPAHEAIFTRSNEFRTFFAETRVHRQLRGDGNPAAIAVVECARSGDLSHNSTNFRPGFHTADGKVLNATGVDQTSGENLAAGFPGLTEQTGLDVTQAWFNSPGHRDNMLNSAWSNDATIPGAQHSIAYSDGTISEQSEDIPNINTYPGGTVSNLWSQVFHKRSTWTPTWRFTHDGDYGETGWEGLSGPQDNTPLATLDVDSGSAIPFQAYFGFRGCRYVLPNSADDPKSVRVLAVAVYQKDVVVGQATVPQLWFRVALLLNDRGEDVIENRFAAYGDGKIQIFTAPVGVTESNYKDRYGYYEPDKDREWELEGEYSFPFALDGSGKGWLYPAFVSAAISSDGTKFCFSYQRYKIATQPLLHRSSTDFTQTTDRDVMVTWIVHIEKEVDGGWSLNEQLPPTATVAVANLVNTPSNYRNSYTRTLKTTYNYMPYYDTDNDLQYVQLSIDDFQTQAFEGHMWRVRKLIFGSGKEVLVDYQALENFWSPNFVAFSVDHPTFPLQLGFTRPFNSVILYLDPVNEDIVLARNYCPNEQVIGAINGINYSFETDLDIDLGTGTDRVDTTLCRRTHQESLVNIQTFLAAAILVNAGNPIPFVGGEYKIDTCFSFMVYNYKSPAGYLLGPFNADTQNEVENVIGGTWPDDAGYYMLGVTNRCVQWFANWDGTGGTDQYDPASYGAYDIEGMYNADDYEVSVWQPPFEFFRAAKDNMYQERGLFNDQIAASLYTDNASPLFTDFRYSTIEITRYKNRIALRGNLPHLVGYLYDNPFNTSYIGPYPSPGTATQAETYHPPGYTAAETVDADARITGDVLLWTNFDLDEAAGISDVIDIQPFGRAL